MMGRNRIAFVLGAGLLCSCGSEGGGESDSCPTGQMLVAGECVDYVPSPIEGDSGAGSDAGSGKDSGTSRKDSGIDTADGGSDQDGGEAPPVPEASAPFYVDQYFAPSGYMGFVSGIARSDCAEAGPSGELAFCHVFSFTPGGEGWGGVYWQYPEHNWTAPGIDIVGAPTHIRFWAWGDAGGEVVTFGSGIDAVDGYQVSTELTLTTTPTEYALDLRGVAIGKVAGGFYYATGSAGSFHVDGARFLPGNLPVVDPDTDAGADAGHDAGSDDRDDADAGVDMDAGLDGGFDMDAGPDDEQDGGFADPDDGGVPDDDAGADDDAGPGDDGRVALPMVVDDHYFRSGLMASAGTHSVDEPVCAPLRPGGARGECHRITWTPPAPNDWVGVFFQHPENNWGDADGLPLEAGATSVSFYAWGLVGGETAEFKAGINGADGFEISTGALTLSTTPTKYTIDLSLVAYDKVVGGFAWFMTSGDETTMRTIFIDDIVWE